MPELLSVPRTEPNQIGAIRKAADRACNRYAKILRQKPDDLWHRAMKADLPEDVNDYSEGREFADAFARLHRVERMEILNTLALLRLCFQ